ncbi:aminoglycoside 6'-N-acetyltransferase [Clostridium sp.]|uniref:aminoglycoside 6'-N-acetyltransferase n=1 Tax=Clostridium sp. TaxID=1506 RepID=UPI003217B711
MNIFKATSNNVNCVSELALRLWENNTIKDLEEEFGEILSNSRAAIFICEDNNEAVGFAQFSLRTDYVEGTDNSPVGYLEGIYLKPKCRGKGFAKELILVGEQWSSEMGCTQIASDCELTNTESLNFHLKSGFSEANRIICFVKNIEGVK